MNDQMLVAKVSSEVLGQWRGLRGRVSLNSCSGVVDLRGTCDSEDQIAELEAQVRQIPGVVDVRNYLHLPGRTGREAGPV